MAHHDKKKLTDFQVLTFDIYGTLIDWETGIIKALEAALGPITTNDARKRVLQVVHELEAQHQAAHPEMLYADVLAVIYPALVSRLGGKGEDVASHIAADDARRFGASVPLWPAFPDTVAALRRLKRRYKLVVLSNVDRDSFGGTNSGPLEGFEFDLVITAQDVGSYKPDKRNFEYMLEKVREEFGVERGGVLQTAQSQFHDHHPARRAGVKSSWIVRPGAIMGNVEKGREDEEVWDFRFDTLGEMADALD